MKRLAWDPGKTGGITYGDGPIPKAVKMPDTIFGACEIIREYMPDEIFLEEVNGYGGNEQAKGSAMFNFGNTFWGPQWAAAILDIRVNLVKPQRWQKALALGSSGGDKAAFKKHLQGAACRLFPTLKPTLLTCDSILIYHAAFTGKI